MSKESRALLTGKKLGESIISMVHLMYQNNTASNFYKGLMHVLNSEIKNRKTQKAKKDG